MNEIELTYQEAIKAIEDNRPTSGYTVLCTALDMACDALREKLERSNAVTCDADYNPCDDCQKKCCGDCFYHQLAVDEVQRRNPKPLTIAELRAMVGGVVWAVNVDGSDVMRERKCVPCVLDFTVGFGQMRPSIIAIYGRNLSFGESDYWKTWKAYRHPLNGQEPGRSV